MFRRVQVFTFFLYCILFSSFVTGNGINERPVIGLLTCKFFSLFKEIMQKEIITPQMDVSGASEYLPASYVKLIESAGARVVPISFESTAEEFRDMFSRVNGVVIPGGAASIKKHYALAATTLWEHVEANPGYPVLGICLGFELVAALAAGDLNFADFSGTFSALNISLNLEFADEARSSKMFEYVYNDPHLVHAMENNRITFHDHKKGVSPTVFYQYPTLYKRFNILATSYDRDGREFVSAFEGKGSYRNIFGIQFHPEKVLFEWNKITIVPKTNEAMRANRAIVTAFVEASRTNTNVLVKDESTESEYLVESYTKLLMKSNFYFTEVYLFFPDHLPEKMTRKALV